jgi:hypothetical protein
MRDRIACRTKPHGTPCAALTIHHGRFLSAGTAQERIDGRR